MAEEPQEPHEGLSRRALLNTAGAVGGTVLAASMLSGTAAAQTQASPITANRFALVVDGVEVASFSDLVEIVAEVEAAEYLESTSGSGGLVTRLIGKAKPPVVVLKRGMTNNMELWAWHEAVRTGQVAQARRSAVLTMFNNTGKPVARYYLENAWPSKLEIGTLSAGSGSAVTETVTFAAEAIQRLAP